MMEMDSLLMEYAGEMLGLVRQPDEAGEIYLAMNASPDEMLGELQLVADQLPDARAAVEAAKRYQIEPGREYATCWLCGAQGQRLCYDLPRAGFCDVPVCENEFFCLERAAGAEITLSRAESARKVIRRAAAARTALQRWRDEQPADRPVAGEAAMPDFVPDGWHTTLRHAGQRSHLLGGMDRSHLLGHPRNRAHLISGR